MKTRTLALLLGCLGTLLPLASVAQEENSDSTKLDTAQRYLVLDTVRITTMRKELAAAAAAGYRVVVGQGRSFLILQKTEGAGKYEYLLPDPGEKRLNEAAAQGFRVLPTTLGSRRNTGDLVLEKAPDSETRYEYRALGTMRIPTMQKEMAEAVRQGYHVVGITKMSTDVGERVMVMERPVLQTAAATPASAPAPINEEQFLLIHTDKTGTLQKELAEAAQKGYRVLDASDDELAVVLEKAPAGQTYGYEVLATSRTSTLEKEINAAAARGLQLLPQTIGAVEKKLFGFMGGTIQTETFAIMEKPPGTVPPHTYKLIATTRTGTLQKELTEAAQSGWELIATSFTAEGKRGGLLPSGEKILILQKVVK